MDNHRLLSNNMRRVHSSPDSPIPNRLVRTKSVPDVMTAASISASVCVSNDVAKQFPDLVVGGGSGVTAGGENGFVAAKKTESCDAVDYRRCIDIEDGLTHHFDAIQCEFEARLADVEARHTLELQKLHRKLELERHARLYLHQMSNQSNGSHNGEALLQDDLVRP